MSVLPKSFEKLAAAFERLPGIGAKGAARISYHLLRGSASEAEGLAEAILSARAAVKRCGTCNMLTETDLCDLCSDPARDPSLLCVVEDPADVSVVERTREFRGRYHVLWGALSPLKGIGPDEIEIASLLSRIDESVREVVVATDPNVEGEATALYLARLLKPRDVAVTRIAFGLPVGGDLEYADEVTMARSLLNRREI
ncbi:MAG: recombination mediator RecR [Thermoanaerobaculia bacterium]